MPKTNPFFVFPLETEDAVYLVKVPATAIARANTPWSRGKNRNLKVPRMKDLQRRKNFESAEETEDYDNEEREGKKPGSQL